MDARFDPDFDDTAWTEGWARIPIAEVPPGVYGGADGVGGAPGDSYRIERRVIEVAEVFGKPYRLVRPLDCRFLYDPEGRMWMSTTPQERIMMYNNGLRSRGHVLVGGLGLGLYPQYAVEGAAGHATRFTAVEKSPAVRAMVEPTLQVALDVPLEVRTGDAEALLRGPVTERYDTIFLDTWETLDALLLPQVNALRDLALRHLSPEGLLLLWGYGWMVRLFEDACRLLLARPPKGRRPWLAQQTGGSAERLAFLAPVLERFEGQSVDDWDAARAWCRRYATTVSFA
jgi:hypothetical protein